MADQTAKYNEEAVGSGHPTKADVINRLVLVNHNTDGTHEKLDVGSDAGGDMYYRAAGVLTRLAKGAAGKSLRMNAAGLLPAWEAGVKWNNYAYDLATVSGTQDLVGAGFLPTGCFILWRIGAGTVTTGFGVGSGVCWVLRGDSTEGTIIQTGDLYCSVTDGNRAVGTLTYTADGGSLAWVKTGLPAGTINLTVLWLR